MLDFNLTPQQEDLRGMAREFALRELLPVAWYYDERDETPVPVLKKAFDAGFMKGYVPSEYGGGGYGLLDGVIVTEELAAACPGLATSIFDNSLGMEPLLLSGNRQAKERYLPRLAGEFKLICFATSEPTMGSDVSGIRCTAEEQEDAYLLNGTKYWVTNGGIADYMTVFATTDPKSKHKGICAFVVELDGEGISRGIPIPKLGQRCSNTASVNFKNVRVPKENMLAAPGAGFVLAMRTFAQTRPAIGAFAVGAARSAMEFAIDYAKKRRAFGAPIADNQAIQFKIAEMYQKVETARLLVWKAAWEADQGLDPTLTASMAKMYATEMAQEVLTEALQIFGGYGYTQMFPIEKLLRDTRLFRIYEGTSEIQRLVIAGYAMGKYEPAMPPLEDLAVQRSMDPEETKGRKEGGGTPVWRCRMCGYVHAGVEPPEACPSCFVPQASFKDVSD